MIFFHFIELHFLTCEPLNVLFSSLRFLTCSIAEGSCAVSVFMCVHVCVCEETPQLQGYLLVFDTVGLPAGSGYAERAAGRPSSAGEETSGSFGSDAAGAALPSLSHLGT